MRVFGTLTTVVLLASVALADIPIPPPAKDEKDVSVTSEVLLGKGVSGWVFVQAVGHGPGAPRWNYERVELSEKTAKGMANNARYTYVRLIAVPEAAVKEFKTDKDLFAALEKQSVKGVHEASVGGGTTRMKKSEVKGDSLTRKYTITAIDPKEGIKTSLVTEGLVDEKPKKPEEKKPLAFAEPGYLIGGIAAAVSVTLGGMWLVRRRKVA